MSIMLRSLKSAMTTETLGITYGLSALTQRIFLAVTAEELAEAETYLQERGKPLHVSGICLMGPETMPSSGNDGMVTFMGMKVPLAPLNSIAEFPEARVLLYSSNYVSARGTLGCLSALEILKYCACFSLAPEPDPEDWYRRRNPDLYATYGAELEDVYAALEDEPSKKAFSAVVKMLVTGELGYLKAPAFAQYEHPAAKVRPGDHVIDGGVYSLEDTLRLYRPSDPGGMLMGFEPEPSQFQKIRNALNALPDRPNMHVFPFGLGAQKDECHVVSNGAGSWLTRIPKDNSAPCSMYSVDSFVEEQKISKIDVIKLDVEGCELDALRGAERTIRAHRPRLMICAYHKYEDLFTLPRLLRQFVPEYKLYFAHHHMFAGEFVFYLSV